MDTFGSEPRIARFSVSANADFNAYIENVDEDWPLDTVWEIRWEGGPTYTATIDGRFARFAADKADVYSQIIRPGIREARVFYNGDIYVWVGDVEVTR